MIQKSQKCILFGRNPAPQKRKRKHVANLGLQYSAVLNFNEQKCVSPYQMYFYDARFSWSDGSASLSVSERYAGESACTLPWPWNLISLKGAVIFKSLVIPVSFLWWHTNIFFSPVENHLWWRFFFAWLFQVSCVFKSAVLKTVVLWYIIHAHFEKSKSLPSWLWSNNGITENYRSWGKTKV